MASKKSRYILNQPPRRQMSRGKVQIRVEATPIVVDMDKTKLGEPIAEAIAQLTSKGIRSIVERTQDGKRRLANATGRLAAGMRISKRSDGHWDIRAPADRLRADEWAPAKLEAFLARLYSLVPILSRPKSQDSTSEMKAARKEIRKRMVKVKPRSKRRVR